MLLEVDDLNAHYGKSHVLQGVSLRVDAGETVCLLGRNGVGKSTTLKAIMGLVPPTGGAVLLKGRAIERSKPWTIARLGIGYVPEDRRVFGSNTVLENLLLGAKTRVTGGKPAWTVEQIFRAAAAIARAVRATCRDTVRWRAAAPDHSRDTRRKSGGPVGGRAD